MNRSTRLIGVFATLLVIALAFSACAESEPGEAGTPDDAVTVPNNAPQTDANGEFVEPSGGDEEPGGGDEPGPKENPEDLGDPIAGEAAFVSAGCAGCHLGNGNEAGGVGPKLAERDLSGDGVKTIVIEGRGTMPGGLASGDDLDNIAAYVVSLQ